MINPQQQIISTLGEVGYTTEMFSRNVNFVKTGGGIHKTELVAYSNQIRKDSDTAVIAIKRSCNVENISYEDISPFKSIATPIIIFYDSKPNKDRLEPLFRTVGLSYDEKSFKEQLRKERPIPISNFKDYVKEKCSEFSPRRLESVKWGLEQLTLFDVYPDLLKQAFKIINEELITHFQKGVDEVLKQHNRDTDPKKIIEYSIKFLASRILRDKKKQQWSLSNLSNYFSEANHFLPDYFSIPQNKLGIIEPLFKRLHSGYDLSQVSIDMVGEVYETFYVDDRSRERAGIHYTNSRLAATLLNRMPIEEIEPEKRLLFDPTCGSGSLLVAGYERLAKAQYLDVSANKRHQELVTRIFGNDKDQIATMIAKMTLMLFHPPHKNNWFLTNFDIENDSFSRLMMRSIPKKPSIIVANPPFGGIGEKSDQSNVKRSKAQRDRSAFVLNKCLDNISDGGLIGIILTETILDQKKEREFREKVLKESEIIDQWTIPHHWFPGVNRNALGWIIRKRKPKKSKAFICPWSDVPIIGEKPKLKGIIEFDINTPPSTLVSSDFGNILTKIERSPNHIKDFYTIMNGFRNPKYLSPTKTKGAHPYSGNAIGTSPFTELQTENNGWVKIAPADVVDNNFNSINQRKRLREIVKKKYHSVLFRASRNTHGSSNTVHWSSVALIDAPKRNQMSVAASESFHAIFSNNKEKSKHQFFIYALWAILNHPIASFYIHEKQTIQWVSISTLKNFPLPKSWDLITVKKIADISSELINESRKNQIGYNRSLSNLIDELDNTIYQLYNISKDDRNTIESNLQFPLRPGVNKLIENYCGPSIFSVDKLTIKYDCNVKKTTFEVLSIDPKERRICLAIDGLSEYPKNITPTIDGVWVNIVPQMPGWIYEIGKTGWIELTTSSCRKVIEAPENYILSIKPFKNAFNSHDEIKDELMSLFDGTKEA